MIGSVISRNHLFVMRNILKNDFDVDGQVVIWRNHNCDGDFRNHDHDEDDFEK